MADISYFWKHVRPDDTENGCWRWGGTIRKQDGYGVLYDGSSRRQIRAHRFAWELFNGPIAVTEPPVVVCHSCDNPSCVRPSHLFLGSQKENLQDMASKGRHGLQAHPDRRAVGERNGSHTHPEKWRRGAAHHSAKLTAAQVAEIRARHAAGGIMQKELAAEFGMAEITVSRIIRGITWQSLM